MKSLIQKLVETTGPSGYETRIREVIQNEIRPDIGQVDAMGNLIVRKGQNLPRATGSCWPLIWMKSD
jgi:tetrahedral aminopeptidase